MIMGWEILLVLVVVAALLCAVGFYKYVYFISIGYGVAIAGIGVTLMVLFGGKMTLVHYLLCLLLVAYGIRLSGFLLYREIKSVAYRKTLAELTREEKPLAFVTKISIWLAVSVLYVAQTSPVFYGIWNDEASSTLLLWIGVVVSLSALLLEALADKQKSNQKLVCPNMVATKGLYKIVRCPNYLGEILFWTGILISGLSSFNHWGQWVMALSGYFLIVLIMFNGAYRLEKRQLERYGAMTEYQDYVNHTPIILPFIPLYHLVKIK